MSYRRSKERNRRLKKLYDKTKNYYGCGVWYNDKKGRYIRYYPSNVTGYTKYLRRLSNRKVRKTKDIPNGNAYKRVFDYWWELF